MLFSLWVSEFFLKISSLNEVFPFFFPFLNCLSRVPFQWSFHSSLYSVVVSFVYMVVRFSFAGIWLAEIHKLTELMVHGLSLAPPPRDFEFSECRLNWYTTPLVPAYRTILFYVLVPYTHERTDFDITNQLLILKII